MTRVASAALVAAALFFGAGSASAQAITPEAKEHFKAGVALLQDPEGERVEEAYREFRTAFDMSGSPQILGNMGFCAMRLERDGEAIDAYSRYLREVPNIDADERAQIVRDLQTLSVGVARVTLEAPEGAIVLDERVPVRGQRVTNVYGPVKGGKLQVGIRPGHHVFTARLAGRDDAVWEAETFAGGKDEHAFVLAERKAAPVVGPPVVAEARGGSVGPAVVLAGGGLALAASLVTGIVSLNRTGNIKDSCPNDVCPASYDLADHRSAARTWVTTTDVLLLVGGVAVVAGGIWGWFEWRHPKKDAPVTGGLSDWRFKL